MHLPYAANAAVGRYLLVIVNSDDEIACESATGAGSLRILAPLTSPLTYLQVSTIHLRGLSEGHNMPAKERAPYLRVLSAMDMF